MLMRIISHFSDGRTSYMTDGKTRTDNYTRGIPHGTLLSPILFVLSVKFFVAAKNEKTHFPCRDPAYPDDIFVSAESKSAQINVISLKDI